MKTRAEKGRKKILELLFAAEALHVRASTCAATARAFASRSKNIGRTDASTKDNLPHTEEDFSGEAVYIQAVVGADRYPAHSLMKASSQCVDGCVELLVQASSHLNISVERTSRTSTKSGVYAMLATQSAEFTAQLVAHTQQQQQQQQQQYEERIGEVGYLQLLQNLPALVCIDLRFLCGFVAHYFYTKVIYPTQPLVLFSCS